MASDYEFEIQEKTMGIRVRRKNGESEYVEKTSFSMSLLKHIDAGDDSGFQCRVYCSLREESR